MGRRNIPDDDLIKALNAYKDADFNKQAASDALGVPRKTIANHIKIARYREFAKKEHNDLRDEIVGSASSVEKNYALYRTKDSIEILAEVLNAFNVAGGNKDQAARNLEIPASTFKDRFNRALIPENFEKISQFIQESDSGQEIQFTGKLHNKTNIIKADLPSVGKKAVYIITSCQNNTKIHPGLKVLENLLKWYKKHKDFEICELFIGTFSYNKSASSKKKVKRNTFEVSDKSYWYAPEVLPYIKDQPIEIAKNLVWRGNWQQDPTSADPLRGTAKIGGISSNIFPHATMDLISCPTMKNEGLKFNFCTGTASLKNYIQRRAGLMAEEFHTYGAIKIEVDHDGNWFYEALEFNHSDSLLIMGPEGCKGLYISCDSVVKKQAVHAIHWGDIHDIEASENVKEMGWGKDGILDTLKPKIQTMDDLYSHRNRSHHDIKSFDKMYEKWVQNKECVKSEVLSTAKFLSFAARRCCETIIKHSNHDRHLDKWIIEADYKKDNINAIYYLFLAHELLKNKKSGNKDFNLLEFAINEVAREFNYNIKNVRFLKHKEPLYILGTDNHNHGDQGPDGNRGSPATFKRLGRKMNVGHSHKPFRGGPVMGSGCLPEEFDYDRGALSSRSVTHIVTFNDGTRTHIITRPEIGKWRA